MKNNLKPATELKYENRLAVGTPQAAIYTGFHVGTLTRWARLETRGHMAPVGKRSGKYLWAVSDIRAVAESLFLEGGAA